MGLESHDPVKDFDLIAFTVGYEMSYANILNMLNLAQVPLHAADRHDLKTSSLPAAPACTIRSPWPTSSTFSPWARARTARWKFSTVPESQVRTLDQGPILLEVSKIEGMYVPSFYEHTYNEDGTLKAITPKNGAPKTVTKRIVHDLDHAFYPTKDIVPSTEIVHDRTNLEVFRGCIRGCRFCQAGFTYRPLRPAAWKY